MNHHPVSLRNEISELPLNMKKTIITFLILLFFQGMYGQSFPDFLEVLKQENQGESRMEELLTYRRPKECQDLGNWGAFQMKNRITQRDYAAVDSLAEQILKACPELTIPIFHYYASIGAYLSADYERAIKSLHLALPLVEEKDLNFASRIYMNLGSAHNNLAHLDSAVYYYDACYESYGDKAPSIVLNNLASVKMKLFLFEDAIHYLRLAKDKLKPSETNIARMIAVNELYTLHNLGRAHEADLIFQQAFKDSVLPIGSESAALETLLGYCVYTDDTSGFLSLASRYEEVLDQQGSNKLKVLRVLFHNMDPALWSSVQKGLEFSPYTGRISSSKVDQELSRRYRSLQWTTSILGFILFITAIILIGSYMRKNSAEKALRIMVDEVRKDFSQDSNVKLIRKALEGQGSRTQAIRALLDMDYKLSLQRTNQVKGGSIPWDLFDATEIEVIKLILDKKGTKEIADLRNCSLGHVYNVKTRIRRKLDLDDSPKAIEKWLLQYNE